MAVATWTCSNQNLFSLQIFTSARSANKLLKKHVDKTLEDEVSNGHAAWTAMEEKCNSHTKQPRRAYLKQLYNIKMESGDDPDDFIYSKDGYCERLEVMGQPVPDARYEDIILQALPVEYERVRTASYKRRIFTWQTSDA